MTDTSPEKIQARLWEQILDATREVRKPSAGPWSSGYRTGLVEAYALITGMDYSEAQGKVDAELRVNP